MPRRSSKPDQLPLGSKEISPSSPAPEPNSASLKHATLKDQTPAQTHTDSRPSSSSSQHSGGRSFKQQRMTQFRPRSSRLDTETMHNEKSEFRGFVMLFWVCLGIIMLRNLVHQWNKLGRLRIDLFSVMSRDLLIFGLSDAAMVSFTLLALPLHRLLMNRWIPLWFHLGVKHVLQFALIMLSVWWTFKREWPWPQTATLSLHAVAMFMKMHSYLTTNYEYEITRRKLMQLRKNHQFIALGDSTTPAQSSASSDGLTNRRRVKRVSVDDQKARADAETIQALELELTKGSTTYPNNVTLANFVDYLACPTLVYELEFPRTERIRWSYVAEKTVALFGVVGCIYLLIENLIAPALETMHTTPVIELLLELVIPFTACWLMLFYVMFECVCNLAAELTRFADRSFYEDWWNSITFDEFARKWNKPVHEFLLRHVYLEAISSHNVSKSNATLLTFLFSSILHEFIIAVVAQKVIFVFFVLQMSQIPLIYVGRMRMVRNHPTLANVFFWVGLMSGLPIIAILYTRDYFLRHPQLPHGSN